MPYLTTGIMLLLSCHSNIQDEPSLLDAPPDPSVTELTYQVGADSDWVELALGEASSCGIRPNGIVECWGCRWDPTDTGSWAIQDQCTPPSDIEFTSLSATVLPTCGLTVDGTAACFGHASYFESSPSAGPYDLVVSGSVLACARRQSGNGQIDCWESGYSPTNIGEVFGPGGVFLGIEGGCVLDAAGQVAAFQPIDALQEDLDRYLPPSSEAAFNDLRLGPYGACGRSRTNRTVTCWTNNVADKQEVDLGITVSVLDYDLNYWQGCAVVDDGSLRCWPPFNSDGTTAPMATPPGEYDRVWVGTNHTCARREDAAIVCWGDNEFGQATPP